MLHYCVLILIFISRNLTIYLFSRLNFPVQNMYQKSPPKHRTCSGRKRALDCRNIILHGICPLKIAGTTHLFFPPPSYHLTFKYTGHSVSFANYFDPVLFCLSFRLLWCNIWTTCLLLCLMLFGSHPYCYLMCTLYRWYSQGMSSMCLLLFCHLWCPNLACPS